MEQEGEEEDGGFGGVKNLKLTLKVLIDVGRGEGALGHTGVRN